MRILAIRGRNLASLAGDFEIDFEAEPLAGSGIFAITGPMGAGKSTLLDALMLALFNKLPRLAAAPAGAQLPSGPDQGISATDPRAILRHGAGEGFAEVDFAMPGGGIYRARWSVRRAREAAQGRLQNYEHSFERIDTGERLGGNRTETLAAIQEVVRLTAEQFGRAVLLAQGDFEAFIRADANERALLLERLTGSDIYARLGRKAYEKASDLRTGLDAIRQQIAAQNGLDEEGRAAAELELANAREEEEGATARLNELLQARRWEERAEELATAVEGAEAHEAEALAAMDAALPRRQALERDRATLIHVPTWRDMDLALHARTEATNRVTLAEAGVVERATAEHLAAEAEIEAQIAAEAVKAEAKAQAGQLDQARALDRQIEEAGGRLAGQEKEAATRREELAAATVMESERRGEYDAVASAHGEHVAWLHENAGLQPLVQREEELVACIAGQTNAVAQAAAVSTQREAAETRRLEATARAEAAADSLEAVATRHRALAAALSDAEAAQPAEGRLGELAAESERLGQLALLESDVAYADAALVVAGRAVATTRARHAETSASRDEALARVIALEAELPAFRMRRDDARREFSLLTAAVSEAAEALRADLEEGEPCPVCGSEQHHLDRFEGRVGALVSARKQALAGLEADTAKKEQDLLAQSAAQRALESQLERLAADLEEQGRALSVAEERRNSATAKLRSRAVEAGLAVSDAELANALTQRREAVQAELDALQAALSAAEAARSVERGARAEMEMARVAQADARDAMANEADIVAELDRQGTAHRASADQLAATLDRMLAPLVDWRALPDAGVWLAAQAALWREEEGGRDRAARALPALREAREAAATALSVARARAEAADATLAEAQRGAQTLRGNRAALLDGEAVAEVEQRLASAEESAGAALTAARNDRVEAAQARVAAEARRSEAIGRRDEAVSDHAVKEQRLNEVLGAAGLAIADVVRIAEGGQASIDAEAGALQILDRRLADCRVVSAKCRADLASHKEGLAPALLGAALAGAISEANDVRDVAAARKGEADLKIRMDDQVRAQTAALRATLERATADADIWLKLSDLIGDREGRRFRRFAQGLTLDRLLEHANLRLADIKPRYVLERGLGGDMLIQVVDNDMAGEVRGLHNLSGGERFLVSLALALGLAEMSTTSGVSIESLFIDEGFGALDPASLGQAVALLEQLHASGRRVGVISHVEELKERIPVKVEVTPTGRGSSRIDVVVS
ncbi:MAG TPA: AAA family ATPase [Allosphingosinicella sp.]|nr:AAA family ATPase [Allosphingosinicella sp.]